MAYIIVGLEDLVGEHVLTGADFQSESINVWGDRYRFGTVFNMVLDGTTFSVIEDPEDGYRSAMREIRATDISRVSNMFPPVKVMGTMSDDEDEHILNLIDVETGRVVISVGTEYHDSYYPMFIAEFDPRNMSINQER